MPRRNNDRRRHSGERRASVDPREPGFDARSILVQGLVDRNRAHREDPGRDHPSGSQVHFSGPQCFRRAISAAVIPPNFRLDFGVSKFMVNASLKLGLKITEWLCRSEAVTTRFL